MAAPAHTPPPGSAIDPAILRTIRQASQATQVDFGLLVAQAAQESGFHAKAKSPTSSAAGLFQFIDSTWLQMVRRFGAKYGVGDLAQKIKAGHDGHLHVSDAAARRKILDLRKDPRLAAALAAEYAKLNKGAVERALGRPAQRTDLFMAHFLGAAGAAQFLKAVQHNATASAAELLPEAAAANHAVFYDARSGEARSVAEIYRSFAQRLDTADKNVALAMNLDQGTADASPNLASADLHETRALMRRLGLPANAPGQPLLSVLNTLALSALKLVHGRRDAASRADPALEAATPAIVDRRRNVREA